MECSGTINEKYRIIGDESIRSGLKMCRGQDDDNEYLIKIGLYNDEIVEASMINFLDHKYIIKSIDNGLTEDDMYIIMPYIKNTIRDISTLKLDISEISEIMFKILTAVNYLHDNNIIKRNITLSNILLDVNTSTPYLSDFTEAVLLSLDGMLLRSDIGVDLYKAPELLAGKDYGLPVDIWSLGLVFMYILTGRQLFNPDDYSDHIQQILSIFNPTQQENPFEITLTEYKKYDGLSDYLNQNGISEQDLPEFSLSLMEGMLQIDPKKRLTISQCLKHPFFQSRDEPFNIPKVDGIRLIYPYPLKSKISYLNRKTLGEWLLKVSRQLTFPDIALTYSMTLLDRILEKKKFASDEDMNNNLQKYACCCLYLSGYLVDFPVKIDDIIAISNNSFSFDDANNITKEILTLANFSVYSSIPQLFIEQYNKFLIGGLGTLYSFDQADFNYNMV